MTGGASDDRIDRLRSSLGRLRADLGNLIDVVDADPGGLARRHRLVLEVQVASLRELEQSLEGGILRRRTWSLAEAAVPVIRSLVNAVRRSRVDVPPELLDRTVASLDDLAAALRDAAEGR